MSHIDTMFHKVAGSRCGHSEGWFHGDSSSQQSVLQPSLPQDWMGKSSRWADVSKCAGAQHITSLFTAWCNQETFNQLQYKWYNKVGTRTVWEGTGALYVNDFSLYRPKCMKMTILIFRETVLYKNWNLYSISVPIFYINIFLYNIIHYNNSSSISYPTVILAPCMVWVFQRFTGI